MPKREGIFAKARKWKIDVGGEEFQVKVYRGAKYHGDDVEVDCVNRQIVLADSGGALQLLERLILAVNAISRRQRRRGRHASIVCPLSISAALTYPSLLPPRRPTPQKGS